MRTRRSSPRHAPGRQWRALCYPAVAVATLLCLCAQISDLGAPMQPRPVDSFALKQSLEAGLRVGLSMTGTVDLDSTPQERRAMAAAQP